MSQIVKRSVVVAGRKKSISLERTVWRALEEIATYQDTPLVALLATINLTRNDEKLSSAIRLFLLNFYLEQLEMRRRQNVIKIALRSPIRLH